jgi:hypothetical protein
VAAGVPSALDWLPATARAAHPRVRPATIGTGAPAVGGRLTLVGDVALAVDPLSGHGIALALEAGSRWHDTGYAEWVAESGYAHERMERNVYRSACGAVNGPFWARRRA